MTQPRRALTDSERLDWIRLIRTENVGPITFHRLIEQYCTAKAALAILPELARRGGRIKPLKLASKAESERELETLNRLGARALFSCEPDYPESLAAIDDAPPVIAVRGHIHLLKRGSVAIVGARNASLNGRKMAEALARDLGAAGYLITSGLARGIDAASHRGALSAGTAAVMAGGVDIVYPEENRELYDGIVANGVVLAECPPGVQPQARHFPRRNRIISGMSLGTLVIEAALKSGSLITARMAAEQGRDVMAVPGSPLDPRCQGTNALIKQGAALIENAEDVIHALQSSRRPTMRDRQPDLFDLSPPPPPPPDEADLGRARDWVQENLSPAPVGIDDLVRDSRLPTQAVLTILLELELAGRIERQPGNRVAMI